MESGENMGLFFKKRSGQRKLHCSAVIVAAGSASRMKGVDKIMAEIGGMPVIARTLSVFQNCDRIGEIVVVTREDLLVPVGEVCRQYSFDKVTRVVVGGADRSRSVQNGLNELGETDYVAIHDGARPFVSAEVLEETIRAAERSGAAAPAIPVTDTIKTAQDSLVPGTPDRSTLFAVQTPQIFDMDLICGALYHCIEKKIPLTDDCSAVEQIGKVVTLTVGERTNIKITTQFDLLIGEAIVSWLDAQ